MFTIVGSPVVIDVYISPDDIASMDAFNVDPAKRGWVKFAVGPYSGTAIASADVYAVYNNEAGHYQFVWDNSAVPDGIYRVEAIAFSEVRDPGQQRVPSVQRRPHDIRRRRRGWSLRQETSSSHFPWDTSAILDRDHYEVWRGTAAGEEVWLADTDSTNYTDTAVDNGTTYYYVVRVVDTDGNESPFSAEVSAQPAVQVDTTPPTTPTGFTAVKLPLAPTVNLAWAPSSDPGSPASGVLGYIIERSGDGGVNWTQIEGTYPNVDLSGLRRRMGRDPVLPRRGHRQRRLGLGLCPSRTRGDRRAAKIQPHGCQHEERGHLRVGAERGHRPVVLNGRRRAGHEARGAEHKEEQVGHLEPAALRHLQRVRQYEHFRDAAPHFQER